jgi:hypothetical protein
MQVRQDAVFLKNIKERRGKKTANKSYQRVQQSRRHYVLNIDDDDDDDDDVIWISVFVATSSLESTLNRLRYEISQFKLLTMASTPTC